MRPGGGGGRRARRRLERLVTALGRPLDTGERGVRLGREGRRNKGICRARYGPRGVGRRRGACRAGGVPPPRRHDVPVAKYRRPAPSA